MSPFEVTLRRPADGQTRRLWLRGTEVGEGPLAGPGRTWDTGHPVAACAAFERRLGEARDRGFVLELPEQPPWAEAARLVQAEPDEPAALQLLAEALATVPLPPGLDQLEAAARALPGTFSYQPRASFVRLARVADADEVGLSDGLMPPLTHLRLVGGPLDADGADACARLAERFPGLSLEVTATG